MNTTISNTNLESVDRNNINIAGQSVPVTWDANGAHVSVNDIAAIRDDADANWSREEMADIAYHAEVRMDETYTKAYEIAVPEGDGWHVLDSIRVENDEAANKYAEENFADQEWYVLDASGNNING